MRAKRPGERPFDHPGPGLRTDLITRSVRYGRVPAGKSRALSLGAKQNNQDHPAMIGCRRATFQGRRADRCFADVGQLASELPPYDHPRRKSSGLKLAPQSREVLAGPRTA